MKSILFGGAGFIGTNLTIKLAQDMKNRVTVVDRDKTFFSNIENYHFKNVDTIVSSFSEDSDFDKLLLDQEIVYHLVSTTIPTTANQHISQEIKANVIATVNLLEACVRNHIKKIVFISSGGTVYGQSIHCPITEEALTDPINSYGLQKITIEKLLYLFWYIYGLDYRIIRLANPYGPYQRPNGVLGAVTTFTYKAIRDEEIIVYGDGTVIRDFIYIDDAINAILKIVDGENAIKLFNVGSGYGTSIKEVLEIIGCVLKKDLNITYQTGRSVDVPENYLDISRYEKIYGKLNPLSLEEGITKMVRFITEKNQM